MKHKGYVLLLLAALLPCCLHSTEKYMQSIEDSLNELITSELETFVLHQSLAVYYDRPSVGLKGFYKFFLDRADRMIAFARKTMSYVNRIDRYVVLKTLQHPVHQTPSEWQNEWPTVVHSLKLVYKRELDIYNKINKIYITHCKNTNCNGLHTFLDEFILAQLESNAELKSLMSLLSRPFDTSTAEILIDRGLRK